VTSQGVNDGKLAGDDVIVIDKKRFERAGVATPEQPFDVEVSDAVGPVGVGVEPTDPEFATGNIVFTEITPDGPISEPRSFFIPSRAAAADQPRGVDNVFQGKALTDRTIRVQVRVGIGGRVRILVSGEQSSISIKTFE